MAAAQLHGVAFRRRFGHQPAAGAATAAHRGRRGLPAAGQHRYLGAVAAHAVQGDTLSAVEQSRNRTIRDRVLVARSAHRRHPGGAAVRVAVWIRFAAQRLAQCPHHIWRGARHCLRVSAAAGGKRCAGVQPGSAGTCLGTHRAAGVGHGDDDVARALAAMQRLSRPLQRWLVRLLAMAAEVEPYERRAVLLAFMCNFVLLGSYYILRPVRDTVATVIGVGQLQNLFTATFLGTLLASPIYAALAARFRLTRLLPGVFGFWLLNVLLFELMFRLASQNLWVAAAYYVWFSVANLFMISVFWSLMVDMFTAAQATRLFALIAAGGSIGAIAGPLLTQLLVSRLRLSGLLLVAAGGFLIGIVLGLRVMG